MSCGTKGKRHDPHTDPELDPRLARRGRVPEPGALAKAALEPHALSTKTKELIALGISVATRCDGCIAFHAEAAVRQGASREEIMETMGMAIYMGAGPSVMYAAQALEAFDQFSAKAATRTA